MNYDTVRKTLHLSDEHECWRAGFPQSETTFYTISEWVSSGTTLREVCALAGLGSDITDCLIRNARTLPARGAFLRLVAHLHYLLFEQAGAGRLDNAMMPLLPACLGAEADLFYLYVFLSGASVLLKVHGKRGIPPEITTETLSDLQTRVADYRRRTGRWGLDTRAWLLHHYAGRLIGLGRLQYQLFTYLWPFKVYVHCDGRSVALAMGGEYFRNDGRFANADRGERAHEGWASTLIEGDSFVLGHSVDFETGAVSRALLGLDRAVWSEALAPGDPVLAVHIPASGPLDPASCVASLGRVEDFFSRHYPDWPFKALTCATWLLESQFKNHLAHSSNIVAFQQLFDLLPDENASDDQFFERVFDGRKERLDELPADNSLRRILIDHMRRGNRWRTGAGVILRSHLGHRFSGSNRVC